MKEHIKPMVDSLQEKLSVLLQGVLETRNTISSLQKLCEHSWGYEGHGHNYDSYKCSICGLEKEV